jgi:hypothetical protein
MPSPVRESQQPEDIAMQITVGSWLVAASGGLTAAQAGQVPGEQERAALVVLRDTLRSAAEQESLVAISGELGLVSAREAAFLVDAVGADAAPVFGEMAEVLAHAEEGHLDAKDEQGLQRVQRLLIALSDLRLAQARHAQRADPPEPWWPTTLSSAS